MGIAIDNETHEEMARQLAQCEADAADLQKENAALRTALDEACLIALGTDLSREYVERVRELRSLIG